MPLTYVANPVAEALASEIRSGARKPGDFIPSVRALAQGHLGSRMSTTTALKVHRKLGELGLVKVRYGRGTVVADPETWPTV